MKFTTLQAVLGSAALLASLPECAASFAHRRLHHGSKRLFKHHHKHSHHHEAQLAKRSQCAFPTDEPDLVAVTPGSQNGGWAMSEDQPCLPGHYCPYACKPGMVMAQWDPDSTYTYPASMNGGLFCDESGNMQKPFTDKPLCVQGTGSVKAVNKAGAPVSWCQTVLPGNEAMLIPTVVSSLATLAVPDINYWQKSAAHYYLNGPGTGADDCIWGDSSKALGNWTPFVAGANTDQSGLTFVKLGVNPVWEDSDLFHDKPSYGVKIECDGGGCQGLPCAIEPGTGAIQGGGTNGAGGAAFCVVTVPKGGSASIVVYGGGDDSASGSASALNAGSSSTSSSSAAPTSSSDAMHAAALAEEASGTSSATSTTTSAADSTSAASSTAASSTTHAASASSSTTSTATKASSTAATATSGATSAAATPSDTTADSNSASASGTQTSASLAGPPTVKPGGIFRENSTASTSAIAAHPTTSQSVGAPKSQADAVRHPGGGAFAGLVIAFIATTCLF